ncbi:hypothetical protein MNBD_GAMMA01-1802 [hydrothermal vent metagenome]|uniref:Integrase catalytic domain-containing protein n=1 Tax=hydrothermal vent metagenome TaxID=652676 RepID=A0A3B0UXA0_9ZZZZ
MFVEHANESLYQTNCTEAKAEILNYIIGYYSQARPHQHNGGRSPNVAEENYWNDHYSVTKITWPLQISLAYVILLSGVGVVMILWAGI